MSPGTGSEADASPPAGGSSQQLSMGEAANAVSGEATGRLTGGVEAIVAALASEAPPMPQDKAEVPLATPSVGCPGRFRGQRASAATAAVAAAA